MLLLQVICFTFAATANVANELTEAPPWMVVQYPDPRRSDPKHRVLANFIGVIDQSEHPQHHLTSHILDLYETWKTVRSLERGSSVKWDAARERQTITGDKPVLLLASKMLTASRKALKRDKQKRDAMQWEHEIATLRLAITKHRIVVMRSQKDFTWEKQLQFTEMLADTVGGHVFEEASSINRKKRPRHAEKTDSRVAWISNDERRGGRSIGTEGWHVDGNVAEVPHRYTLLFCESAIKGGDTRFVALRDIVKNTFEIKTSPLYHGVEYRSAFNASVVHPLIYPHPVTGDDTMVFGLGSLFGNARLNNEAHSEVELGPVESAKLLKRLTLAFKASSRGGRNRYERRWKWKKGDFLIIDNLAIAHVATKGTQRKRSKKLAALDDTDLRLMRRTTVAGHNVPMKRERDLSTLPHACVHDPFTFNGYHGERT